MPVPQLPPIVFDVNDTLSYMSPCAHALRRPASTPRTATWFATLLPIATGANSSFARWPAAPLEIALSGRVSDEALDDSFAAIAGHWSAHQPRHGLREPAAPVDRHLRVDASTGRGEPSDDRCSLRHPALRGWPTFCAAAAHKQHLADRLLEPCADTSAADPSEEITQDLLLTYEGMHTMITMHLAPHPISRARHLAIERLARSR